MFEMIIEVGKEPEWVIGYFRQFRKWQENDAPKPLPKDIDSYITLFSKHIGIEYNVESIISSDGTRIESLRFTWEKEQDRTFFILKF
jgi:hypothetical protein